MQLCTAPFLCLLRTEYPPISDRISAKSANHTPISNLRSMGKVGLKGVFEEEKHGERCERKGEIA